MHHAIRKRSSKKSVNKNDSTEETACLNNSIKKTCKVIENESKNSKCKSFVKITTSENVPAIVIVTPCSSSVFHNENESLQDSIPTRSNENSEDSDQISTLLLQLDKS